MYKVIYDVKHRVSNSLVLPNILHVYIIMCQGDRSRLRALNHIVQGSYENFQNFSKTFQSPLTQISKTTHSAKIKPNSWI
jgi:hypothetical protein